MAELAFLKLSFTDIGNQSWENSLHNSPIFFFMCLFFVAQIIVCDMSYLFKCHQWIVVVFLVLERKVGECGTAIEELRNSVDELEIKKGLYHHFS